MLSVITKDFFSFSISHRTVADGGRVRALGLTYVQRISKQGVRAACNRRNCGKAGGLVRATESPTYRLYTRRRVRSKSVPLQWRHFAIGGMAPAVADQRCVEPSCKNPPVRFGSRLGSRRLRNGADIALVFHSAPPPTSSLLRTTVLAPPA
jgi:hypothetical protein